MENSSDLQCWAYVRGYGVMPSEMSRRMAALLTEADQLGFTVVGNSMECSSGKTLRRMALFEALRAVRLGYANAVLVHEAVQISEDKAVLLRALEIMQDNHALLVCIAEDAYTRLHGMGLSQQLIQRAFSLGLDVPWLRDSGNAAE